MIILLLVNPFLPMLLILLLIQAYNKHDSKKVKDNAWLSRFIASRACTKCEDFSNMFFVVDKPI
jgi:hypothetical protein